MKVKSALVAKDNTKHYERYAALLSGMVLRVDRACDGVDALAMAKAGRYAVVVLDVNLPRLGGLEVLKAVRRTKPYLPIIVVSEFVGPAAEAECINMGADDFISKSFHDNSFQARVRRAIWHGSLVGEVTSLRWGEVSVDDANQIVFYAGKVVELSEKEYNILLPIVRARGRRVDSDVLEIAAWGGCQAYVEAPRDEYLVHSRQVRENRCPARPDRLQQGDWICSQGVTEAAGSRWSPRPAAAQRSRSRCRAGVEHFRFAGPRVERAAMRRKGLTQVYVKYTFAGKTALKYTFAYISHVDKHALCYNEPRAEMV